MSTPLEVFQSLNVRSPALIEGSPELAVADAMGRVTLYMLNEGKVSSLEDHTSDDF